jgi:hypothetical protein
VDEFGQSAFMTAALWVLAASGVREAVGGLFKLKPQLKRTPKLPYVERLKAIPTAGDCCP